MDSKSTYLEQDLVNILASMTMNIANYPRIFYEAGYRIEFTEREFDANLEGKPVEVKFDLVLNNLEKNHAISFECKSGKTEAKQLQKYSKLTPKEMVQVGGVSSDDVSAHTHDIAIVYNSNNHEGILTETDEYNFVRFSVSKNPTLVSSTGHTLYDDDLELFFQQPIRYPDFIHEVFNIGASTPTSKYILLISTVLVTFSVEKKDHFNLEELAAAVATTYPGLYPSRIGQRLRKEIETKIDKVMEDASKHELKGFFAWDRRTKTGELLKLKPGCKPATFKSFKDLAQEMSERLRTGAPVSPKYISKKEDLFRNQITMEELLPEEQF